jgi:hypothetical protein
MKRFVRPFFLLFCGSFFLSVAAKAEAAPAMCTPPPSGMVSWWPGDGNANDIADGNNGTLMGGVSFTTGKVGQAFSFSNDGDGVTIPDNPNLNVQSSGFTADFWMRGIKNQTDPSLSTIFEKSHGFIDATGWAYQVEGNSGHPRFAIGDGTGFPEVKGAVDVLDGNFHHIAGTWDGSMLRLYVDGVLQPDVAVNLTPANNNRAVNIGFTWGGGTPRRFFRGVVDEIEVFNRALSEPEIEAIFQADSAGKCKTTTLSFTAASATTSDFHDAAQVQAQLTTTGGAPVPNVTVTFTLGAGSSAPTCSAPTDATGTATCLITPNQAAGPDTLTATFAGDASFGGSSASTTFTITKEETTLKFTASSPTLIANGQAATFAATLKEDGTTAISGRAVTITLGSGAGAQSCTGTTNSSGTASCTINVNQPLGPNTVVASFSADAFYRSASDTEAVIVFGSLGSGSFVIGDLDGVAGDTVTFWSAKWTELNSLSGGPAPAAFKGFADTTQQNCGRSWTSRSGNSSNPPDSVPSFMAVIASSSITKSGAMVSGNAPKIVIVKTDPGYAAAPGHTGTGTVVGVLCGR